MDYQRFVSICYPSFRDAAFVFEQLTLKQRALLIKTCQAQRVPRPNSTLHNLTAEKITIMTTRTNKHAIRTIHLHDVFSYINKTPEDPCVSAILLDLLRCCPASTIDYSAFVNDGWTKEIILSETPNRETFSFDYFFDLTYPHPFYHLVPDNQVARAQINRRFHVLKKIYLERKVQMYPRATHKNMSRETRREYERSTKDNLEGIPIFGQDDWQRHYHKTGEQLGGSIEMRQKWYPSNAKPRTYFAQGGTAYTHSRFLQDFFTTLVNAFPSTHHETRLQPYRLRFGDPTFEGHFLVYDLSSFTSNMVAQRDFCDSLARFFLGVEVEIFDEHYGLLTVDMGEMLLDYNEYCVFDPVLNQERVPDYLRTQSEPYPHARASMLGIYGNLMTCTVSHFLIVANTVEDPFSQDNTAGDDGLILFFLFTYFSVLIAISLVGVYAVDKTFRSDEDGSICLKRPLYEVDNYPIKDLALKDNIVPPNFAVSVCYLLDENVDPRYTVFYGSAGRLDERISVVGKDMFRFLNSAFEMNYSNPFLLEVFDGYCRLVRALTGHYPVAGGRVESREYFWPVRPSEYAFLVHDPYLVYAWITSPYVMSFPEMEDVDYESIAPLKFAGDVGVCNSCPWLRLMETLGYVEKEERRVVKVGDEVVTYLYMILRKRRQLPSTLYTFKVNRDVPVHMLV